ncbi:MAG: DNA repair protein RadC [Paludibacteraceae bacterium]|nr:DNA repair protein RadC [Paludibacteraceae bacterium]
MTDKLNINQWNESDRPRERMMHHGARSLSDAELLAILLRVGSTTETALDLAKRILATYGNDLDRMGRELNIQTLCRDFRGVGQTKAVTIMAALELGRRRKEILTKQDPQIINSQTAFEIISPLLMDLPTEEMWVLLLNRQNRLIDKQCIGKGGIAGVTCDVRVVMRMALEHNATSIILAHNHPSGSNQPSKNDKDLTLKISKACSLLDISLHDHIIIARHTYYSFADAGLL